MNIYVSKLIYQKDLKRLSIIRVYKRPVSLLLSMLLEENSIGMGQQQGRSKLHKIYFYKQALSELRQRQLSKVNGQVHRQGGRSLM